MDYILINMQQQGGQGQHGRYFQYLQPLPTY